MNAFARDIGHVARSHARCIWLDGAAGRDWSGRSSTLAWLEPSDVSLTYDAARGEVTRHANGAAPVVGADPFEVLAREIANGAPDARWFGYFGYAARPDLPALKGGPVPDAVWMCPSHIQTMGSTAATDSSDAPELDGTFGKPGSRLGVQPRGRSGGSLSGVPAAYQRAFDRVQEHLMAGDTYELNLTYRDEIRSARTPVDTYLRLREVNPAPYAAFLQHDVAHARSWLLTSSPERFARVTAQGQIQAKPIKGTLARGSSRAEDARLEKRLREDPRFVSENLMIADLLRNDLGMVCVQGSVTVPALMGVESYETVHQLVTTVQGQLREGVSTLEALRAIFPAGSMTGAPKRRTMELIADIERTPRSVYAGAFGWIGASGEADLGVVIRSLFTSGDGRWSLGTGGGITVHSSAVDEYAEARLKAERLYAVLRT